MKRPFYLIAFAMFSIAGTVHSKHPGGGIVSEKSIFIPARLINSFFNCEEPDSARLVLVNVSTSTKYVDTTSREYALARKIENISAQSSLEDFRAIIQELGSLRKTNCFFRLYYKGSKNQFYKVRRHKLDGVLTNESILLDLATRIVEQSTFYHSGNMMSRQQYRILDTSVKLSNWYGAKLTKEGKKISFYSTGRIKSIYLYRDDKRNDSSFVYNRSGELLYWEFWRNDTLLTKKANTAVSGVSSNAGQLADPRRKALLVGVDKYRYPDKETSVAVDHKVAELVNLAGCKNDVDILSKALKGKRGFLASNIHSYMDDDATKNKLVGGLNKFIETLKKGDIVFLHFSGIGFDLVDTLSKSKEFAFACRDAMMGRYVKDHDGYLRKKELETFFAKIKKSIGRNGQLILSIDACAVGSFGDQRDIDTTKISRPGSDFRGETSDLIFNFMNSNDASSAVFLASSGSELSMEMRADDDKTYGLYSYLLAEALRDPAISSTNELYDEVMGMVEEHFLTKNGGKTVQHPTYYKSFDFPLFEPDEASAKEENAMLPNIKQTGNAYVLSVGVSHYTSNPANAKLKFNNCVNDAKSYASFFKSQFADIEGQKKLNSYLLTDSTATYKNIMAAINEIIFNSKPDDYFVFNFSGYCRQLSDSNGKRVTYFVPYGLKNIADTNEIKTKGKGIPLSQLKDLLQLIPANNQLFITEAGSTTAFQKEFIQALIESSPTIAALSNKNRVFMVPRSSGMDKFYCENVAVEHGPLNYYITNLAEDLNIYGLFQGGIYSDAVKYAINKTEINCDYFRTGYFDIFFEREYIKDLQHFLPEELSQSRGFRANTEAKAALAVGNSKRYAMVVGTDKYNGKPDWNDLRNPVLDAKDIARELESGFGYKVKLLLDAPMDSIYAHISWLSRELKKNDQLIIYFAGHGDFDSTLLDDGFIVCRDSKPINMDPYRNSYIQYSKFSRMVNRLPASQILMALDVCFGGTFDERVARNQGRERTTDYDNLTNNAFLAEKLKKKTRLYLTSGGKDVVPDGFDKKHSPFALRLLEVLQGRGGVAKLITAKDLHQFVRKLPSGPLLGSFGDDELGSEFILLGN